MIGNTFYPFTTLRRRVIAGAVVFAIAASVLAPVRAGAEPKSPPGGKGCPVVDENDKVVGYEEVGTQVGLFYCGADGEWHFGWYVNAIRFAPAAPHRAVFTAQR